MLAKIVLCWLAMIMAVFVTLEFWALTPQSLRTMLVDMGLVAIPISVVFCLRKLIILCLLRLVMLYMRVVVTALPASCKKVFNPLLFYITFTK